MSATHASPPTPSLTIPPPSAITDSPYWTEISWKAISLLVWLLNTIVNYVLNALVGAIVGLINLLIRLLSRLFATASYPAGWILDSVQFITSPVTYTLSYMLAPVFSLVQLLSRLRPLYTYLGSAAFIGIVTGIALKLASNYLVAALQLDSDDHEETWPSGKRAQGLQGQPAAFDGRSEAPPAGPQPQISFKAKDRAEPQDDVWQWLEEFNPRRPEVGVGSSSDVSLQTKQALRPGGLLSVTILEESSSE